METCKVSFSIAIYFSNPVGNGETIPHFLYNFAFDNMKSQSIVLEVERKTRSKDRDTPVIKFQVSSDFQYFNRFFPTKDSIKAALRFAFSKSEEYGFETLYKYEEVTIVQPLPIHCTSPALRKAPRLKSHNSPSP